MTIKNHFFFGYAGNKRNEVENIVNKISLNNITHIVEPFCGSCCLSWYISTLHPKKFTYILNDNNGYLIQLLKIARDKEKFKKLIKQLNNIVLNIDKEKYDKICKLPLLSSWIIKHKIYAIRPGLFPLNYSPKTFDYLEDCPIVNFLRTEKIYIKCIDGISLLEKVNKYKKCLIFMDPPYLSSCNDLYYNSNTNIYKYIFDNPIDNYKAKIYLCLENIWIIKLLFHNQGKILDEYNKTYEMSKKKTTHIIISN